MRASSWWASASKLLEAASTAARVDEAIEVADGGFAGGRHLEGRARGDARRVVVRSSPVGDDGAVEAPLVAQNLAKQVLILVRVHAVDQVVRAHDGLGRGFADDGLEAGEVNLAQGPLVEHGVGRLAAGLLGVHGEVLGARGDALRLDAAHVGGGHLAREVGVLREVLEVAAAQRVALDAQARAEQHVDALGRGLLGHGGADALAELLVPGVRHGDGGGEAGRGLGAIQAEVVGRARLVPHAVGPVGELDCGDAALGQRPAPEGCLALEELALLFERELADDVRVLHACPFAPVLRL